MKVFFTASISRENTNVDIERYSMINNYINTLGHESTNYSYYKEDSVYRLSAEKNLKLSSLSPYDYVINLITSSDALIADISTQSFKAGYQLDFALHHKIPALVIYRKWDDFVPPIMLQDNRNELLQVREYTKDSEIKQIIKSYLESIATGKMKFNFYINHRIYNYLNRRAKLEGRNKSDIARDIILREINSNPLHNN